MKYKIRKKTIIITLYQIKGFERFGWWSDKERLKLRVKRWYHGKKLAGYTYNKRKEQ